MSKPAPTPGEPAAPESYAIGALASAAAVPVSTVRYYERIGLLMPSGRAASGYRQYTSADLSRLRFVKLAQSVGFALEETARLLALREQGPIAEAALQAVLRERLAKIDQQLAQLGEVKRALEASLSSSIDSCECSKCAELELLQSSILDKAQPTA